MQTDHEHTAAELAPLMLRLLMAKHRAARIRRKARIQKERRAA